MLFSQLRDGVRGMSVSNLLTSKYIVVEYTQCSSAGIARAMIRTYVADCMVNMYLYVRVLD